MHELDLTPDPSSPQFEPGPPMEARHLQSDLDLSAMQSRHSSQPFTRDPPRGRSVEQSEQKHQNELMGLPKALPIYPLSYPRCCLAPSKDL